MTIAINSLMKTAGSFTTEPATISPILERTHYSGSSGGGHKQSYGSHKGGGGGKHSIALTALTLLAFLFFLNILQNCLEEQMDELNPVTPQIMVVSARIKQPREAEKRKGEAEESSQPLEEEAEEKTYMKIAKRVLEDKPSTNH